MAKMIDAYLDVVEEFLRYLHRPRFARLWQEPTRNGEWCGRYRLTQNYAFAYAVLHHFRGGRENLELARSYLLDFDRGHHFDSVFLAKAYEIVGHTLTEEERHGFAEGWAQGAEAMLDAFVRELDQDWGQWSHVSNHALCACVCADYVAKLFPELGARLGHQRRTDKVWRVWWKRREFWEQASNYEGFSEFFKCVWAELRDVKKEFYSSPSILNMFERGLQIASPAGIVAAYGDSGHNEHATAWIALCEMVAANTRDGRFRQAARDMFGLLQRVDFGGAVKLIAKEQAESNICNARVLAAQYQHAITWLAMAALCADESVKPKPRPTAAGRIRRLPRGQVLTAADKKRLPEKKLVTCQVALTGGDPAPSKRTYLLLSTGPALIHDHADAGAILLLAQGDTVLLGTNGYLQRDLLYHHIFCVQPSSWQKYPDDEHGKTPYGNQGTAAEVSGLTIGEYESYARLSFERYHDLPVDLTREIAIDSSGGVTVVDRAIAREPGWCGGPIYHGEEVDRTGSPRGSSGVSRFRVRQNRLRSMCGIEVANPRGALEVDLNCPSSEIRTAKPCLPASYRGYRGYPVCHYVKIWSQSYTARRCLGVRRELREGETTLFVTRLVPLP